MIEHDRGDAETRDALVADIVRVEDELSWTALRVLPPAIVGSELTWGQLRVLFTIAFADAVSMGDLAKLLGVGRPAASVMTERLVQAGLVGRRTDAADRRRTIVQLAAAGRELIARMLGVRHAMYQRFARHMTDAELRALATAGRALLRAAQRELEALEAAPSGGEAQA